MIKHIDILLEVNTIVAKNLSIQNKRIIRDKKRLLFIADIQSIEEGLILNRTKTDYNDCVNLIMNSGEVVKVNEDFNELLNIFVEFWKNEQELAKKYESETEE